MLVSGCSWFRPQYEPQPDAVQYSDAPLPPQPYEPQREAVQYSHAPLPRSSYSSQKTSRDQVTILPKADGSIGGVVVRSGGVEVLLDKPYASVVVEGPGLVTESTYDVQLAREDFAVVLDALPGEPVAFLLFFLEDSDELTAESAAQLEGICADLSALEHPEIQAIGHTDSVGAGQYNDELSLQRAQRVRGELIRCGIAKDSITVEGRGKREPLVTTADGVPEWKNRRVEINVR